MRLIADGKRKNADKYFKNSSYIPQNGYLLFDEEDAILDRYLFNPKIKTANMNNIATVDPQAILNATNAQFFMVVWTNSQGTFFGTGGGGFQNASHGKMDSPAVERRNAVEEYHNLARVAKSHNIITDGRIDLVELPTFSS